jgi:hypothetical protein
MCRPDPILRASRYVTAGGSLRKRILLFLATNLAVVLTLSVVAHLFGLNRFIDAQGLNLGGLLERMTHDVVEAVLAHEVAHVANGDMVMLAPIQGVVNTFVIAISRAVASSTPTRAGRSSPAARR